MKRLALFVSMVLGIMAIAAFALTVPTVDNSAHGPPGISQLVLVENFDGNSVTGTGIAAPAGTILGIAAVPHARVQYAYLENAHDIAGAVNVGHAAITSTSTAATATCTFAPAEHSYTSGEIYITTATIAGFGSSTAHSAANSTFDRDRIGLGTIQQRV